MYFKSIKFGIFFIFLSHSIHYTTADCDCPAALECFKLMDIPHATVGGTVIMTCNFAGFPGNVLDAKLERQTTSDLENGFTPVYNYCNLLLIDHFKNPTRLAATANCDVLRDQSVGKRMQYQLTDIQLDDNFNSHFRCWRCKIQTDKIRYLYGELKIEQPEATTKPTVESTNEAFKFSQITIKTDRILNFECFTNPKAEPVTYKWYRNGVHIGTGKKLHFQSTTLNETGNYTCAVSNSVKPAEEHSDSFHVEVVELPTVLELTATPPFPVAADTDVILLCTAKGTYSETPNIALTMYWKNTFIPIKSESSTTSLSYTIKAIGSLDNVMITCSAAVTHLPTESVSKNVTTEIVREPTVNVAAAKNPIDIGEEIKIICTGDVTVSAYQWKKDNKVLTETSSTLSVQAAKFSDGGTYNCEITEKDTNKTTNKDIIINVNSKPFVDLSQQNIMRVDNANIGQEVILRLFILAYPENFCIVCYFNGETLTTVRETVNGQKAVKLSIASLKQSNYGDWKCVMENSIGKNQQILSIRSPGTAPDTTKSAITAPITQENDDSQTFLMMAIIFLILFLVFLIAFIIACVCYMRNRKIGKNPSLYGNSIKSNPNSTKRPLPTASSLSAGNATYFDAAMRPEHVEALDAYEPPKQDESNPYRGTGSMGSGRGAEYQGTSVMGDEYQEMNMDFNNEYEVANQSRDKIYDNTGNKISPNEHEMSMREYSELPTAQLPSSTPGASTLERDANPVYTTHARPPSSINFDNFGQD